MNKNKEVLKLLVEIGTVACGDKVVYTINGAQLVAHAANVAKLQQLLIDIDNGFLQVEEKEEPANGSKTDTGQ